MDKLSAEAIERGIINKATDRWGWQEASIPNDTDIVRRMANYLVDRQEHPHGIFTVGTGDSYSCPHALLRHHPMTPHVRWTSVQLLHGEVLSISHNRRDFKLWFLSRFRPAKSSMHWTPRKPERAILGVYLEDEVQRAANNLRLAKQGRNLAKKRNGVYRMRTISDYEESVAYWEDVLQHRQSELDEWDNEMNTLNL